MEFECWNNHIKSDKYESIGVELRVPNYCIFKISTPWKNKVLGIKFRLTNLFTTLDKTRIHECFLQNLDYNKLQ